MSDKFVTYKSSKYQFIFPATMTHKTYSCESYAGIIFDTEKGRFDVVDNPHFGHRIIINPKEGGWSDIPFKPATFRFLPDDVEVSELMNKEEQKYLDMLKDIVENGSERKDRTGVGTRGVFGTQLRFSLEGGKIPMFTSKKLFARGVVEELLFFLRGETDTKILERKGINIWQGNTTREFLDKIGLSHLPEGNMGKMYGHQWRKFGAHDEVIDYESSLYEATPQGVDQIANVINLLKTDPYSRRIVVNAWNAKDLPKMCLAPCHPMFQFYVNKEESGDKLSCCFYMRSSDAFLGLPFNILSYAFLTHILAATVGMEAKELIFMGGDTHVYNNHHDQVKEQLSREPYEFPTLKINKKLSSLEDIEKLEFTDFEISNYRSHPAIKAPMAV